MALSYHRKFVFLLQEDQGYGTTPGATPKGHIEIETRKEHITCKVFVDYLKAMAYEIILLTSQGSKSVVGWLEVKDGARAEGQYTLSNSNVRGTNIPLKDFGVILLRALEGGGIPLVGWLQEEKFPYKAFIKEDLGVEPIKREEIKGEEQLEQEDHSPEQIGDNKEIEQGEEERQEVEIEEKESVSYGEENSLEETYWVDFKPSYPEEEVYEHKAPKANPSAPYYYVSENLEELERFAIPIEPFESPLEGHRWWKITGYERELEVFYLFYNGSFVPLIYPYMGYRNIGDPYIEEYHHWLFGMTFDENSGSNQPIYYVYGIPGRFCIKEQPFQGSTGFLYWHPIGKNTEEKGDMGYWLLYIDARSGVVDIPNRPTMPPSL